MGGLIRLFLLGWGFAIVMVVAWLGMLLPTQAPAPAAEEGEQPKSLIGQDCAQQEMVAVRFFDRSAVVRPESQADIAAFSLRLRSQPCLADRTGNFCTPAQVALALEGHARPAAQREPEVVSDVGLSFQQALAVAAVFMANDMTIRSIEGFEAAEPGPVEPAARVPDAGALDGRDHWVDIGLQCPRVQRP